jgi:AcrR family transcriptional regulator
VSSSRSERTKLRIVDAANRLLLEAGYQSVGLEEVAAAAGVSRQTVYDRFGSKAGLLRAMISRGEDQAGLPERLRLVFAQPDGLAMLRAMLDTVAAVDPKVYAQSRLVYAARLDDPLAAELWNWRLGSRRAGMGAVFKRLAAEDRLRPGITEEVGADVAWAIASPHQYEYLVVERGWSLKRYRAHLEETIASRLLKTP